MLSVDDIAVIAYEASRGYNQVIGDPWIDPPWSGLPQQRKNAMIDGVRKALAGLSPRELHANWCGYFTALGWVHGADKDPNAVPPTHPCLVPYDDLPAVWRRKDAVFRELVLAISRAS